MKSILQEFKDFALNGSVVDIAVGLLIGAGVTPIAKSLIDDIIMPPIAWLMGNSDLNNLYYTLRPGTPLGPYPTRADAVKAGAVTVNYGNFMSVILSFFVIALVAFFMVKMINHLRAKQAPAVITDVHAETAAPKPPGSI